ncbi:MAG: DegT/DnrJ/EryC1/StrS family aminotransferase, partial [Candidatus Margulisbacteria bacterium]|nr:DegT/DnrJ/EryC1/StrS family aminotransferase [Candidatus Margulisiibacteriota bacterium]
MSVNFFDITRQNESHRSEIDSAIADVINSGRFILGENVAKLEQEVAAYSKASFAIGLASGTDALHLALRACGVKKGDEIITSPFTFVATAEAISYIGAVPVFVDIEPNTFNLSPKLIEQKITKKTKAILPIHLYGQPADMVTIMEMARQYKLKVIEDSCQSIGAEYAGKPVNSTSDAGCLSFFPTKNLGCFGDGGMVL